MKFIKRIHLNCWWYNMWVSPKRSNAFSNKLKSVVNGPRWDIFPDLLLGKNVNHVCLMTYNWDAKKSSDIHQYLPTKAKQTYTANHFVHSLKKDKWNIVFFFFFQQKSTKQFLITIRINKSRLDLCNTHMSWFSVVCYNLTWEKKIKTFEQEKKKKA